VPSENVSIRNLVLISRENQPLLIPQDDLDLLWVEGGSIFDSDSIEPTNPHRSALAEHRARAWKGPSLSDSIHLNR
jgi:hypothetical protein